MLSDEQLLANMQSETQYKIRRAQNKDALEFRAPTAPDPSSLAAFHDILAQFAAEKGVSLARMKCLQAAAKAGVLRLGGMVHEGEVLVWHSYLLIGSRVRPMHSASLFRGQAPGAPQPDRPSESAAALARNAAFPRRGRHAV
jgi:hypothetical protein